MNRIVSTISMAAAAAVLAGCAGGGLFDVAGYGKAMAPNEAAVRSGQNLSMPPDLQLRAPSGPVSEDYQPNTAAAAGDPLSTSAAPQKLAAATPARPAGDVYERNGISKFHPDGKAKTDAELRAELKAIYLAKKRQTNPNYGTIWNIGNIFKDE
ncbi:MAG: hypothetical protein ACT4SY_10025 [Hyphomicrobiales bacterium]